MNSWMKAGLVLLALNVPYVGCSRQPDPPIPPTQNELRALRELNTGLRDKCEDLEKNYSELNVQYDKVSRDNIFKSKQVRSLTFELNTRKTLSERFLVSERIDTANYQRKMLGALDKIGKYEDVLQRNGFDTRLVLEGHGDLGPTKFEELKLRYERDEISWEHQTLRFDKSKRGLELGLERTRDENAELKQELGAYKRYHQEADLWIRKHQPNKNPLRN